MVPLVHLSPELGQLMKCSWHQNLQILEQILGSDFTFLDQYIKFAKLRTLAFMWNCFLTAKDTFLV